MAHALARASVALLAAAPAAAHDLPIVTVTNDDTELTESCLVVIPDGTVIRDDEGDGVIRIRTDGITVEFAEGSSLSGAVIDDNWDTLTGVGVRVENASGVTLRNLRVRGYKVGVLATHANGLTVESSDLSDNHRQRLRSTPLREDASDWLSPHHNDEREWVTTHGAALCVERSENVTVRTLRVRRGQNGIILDRVNNSEIYDNDCSFLSGWGLACWRSSKNLISRNAFDFCVRGHSEGVYNRGQDSAGILFFEQCNRNTVVENSATHSGDGFFGFAGREALGEVPKPEDAVWSYTDVGCNHNTFTGNDLSDAAAHGWEMTFSEGNVLHKNRLFGNAICGVWAGYSSDSQITKNRIALNGGMPYSEEGGGVNIEHGSGNVIAENLFLHNTTAVRLWWDDDGTVFDLPGVRSRQERIARNIVARNLVRVRRQFLPMFAGPPHKDRVFRGIWFQDESGDHFGSNTVESNRFDASARIEFEETLYEPGTEPNNRSPTPRIREPRIPFVPGKAEPVGARAHLRGRSNIVMHEWGPWDHESPMIRVHERTATRHSFDVFGVGDGSSPGFGATRTPGTNVGMEKIPGDQSPPYTPPHFRVTAEATTPGVHTYTIPLSDPATGFARTLTGTLIRTTWEARVWAWEADPLDDLDAWRREAEGDAVVPLTLDALDFSFQSRSPADVGMLEAEAAANAEITRDRFGTIATTTIPLTPGRWRLRTLSDDGIRVFVDDEVVIERWDIHGPTPDEAVIVVDGTRDVPIRVEHFENDGWAALRVTLQPAD